MVRMRKRKISLDEGIYYRNFRLNEVCLFSLAHQALDQARTENCDTTPPSIRVDSNAGLPQTRLRRNSHISLHADPIYQGVGTFSTWLLASERFVCFKSLFEAHSMAWSLHSSWSYPRLASLNERPRRRRRLADTNIKI